MADELTPQEEQELISPRRMMGKDSYPGEYEGLARDRTGFFGGLGSSLGHEASNAWRRWKAPVSGAWEEITPGDLGYMAGGRNIPWEPGMTRGRAERLISDYDYEQYSRFYTENLGTKIGEVVGFVGGGFLDPVNVLTMPIGGPEFGLALRAGSTLKNFLYQGFKGASKIAAVSVPLEAGVEVAEQGRVSPQALAATAISPYLLGGAFLGLGRVLNARQMRALADFSENPHVDLAPHAQALAESPDIPPPPVRQYDPDELARAELMNIKDFLESQGGMQRWLRDLSAGKAEAIEGARKFGFDPDSPAIRKLLERQAYFSATRTPPPVEQRFQDLVDFTDVLEGRAVPEQLQRLADRGLLENLTEISRAEQVPGFQRGLEEVRTAREGERFRAELQEFAAKPEFAELTEALRTPGWNRTINQKLAVDRFMRHGVEGIQAQRLDRLQEQYRGLVDRLGALEKDRASRKGKKPKALLDEISSVRASVQELAGEIDRVQGELRNVDEEVPIQEILGALSAARIEAPAPPPLPEPPRDTGQALASTVGPDPTLDDVRKWAKEIVKDEESLMQAEETVSKLDRAMKACGVK